LEWAHRIYHYTVMHEIFVNYSMAKLPEASTNMHKETYTYAGKIDVILYELSFAL
jgi:hypothetical protein